MSDKIPYSSLRNPISFISSKSLRTVASAQSKEEDKEKLAENITKFYQSIISLPPTKNVRKSKIKTRKKRQGIINKKIITNDNSIENRSSLLNVGTSSSNNLAKLSEHDDEDESEIKHINKKENVDNKIWCVDCEIWVEKHLYQSHIHGTAHLVTSKSLNDQSIPDPLALNEVSYEKKIFFIDFF